MVLKLEMHIAHWKGMVFPLVYFLQQVMPLNTACYPYAKCSSQLKKVKRISFEKFPEGTFMELHP